LDITLALQDATKAAVCFLPGCSSSCHQHLAPFDLVNALPTFLNLFVECVFLSV
jgi:hypothetical protein